MRHQPLLEVIGDLFYRAIHKIMRQRWNIAALRQIHHLGRIGGIAVKLVILKVHTTVSLFVSRVRRQSHVGPVWRSQRPRSFGLADLNEHLIAPLHAHLWVVDQWNKILALHWRGGW